MRTHHGPPPGPDPIGLGRDLSGRVRGGGGGGGEMLKNQTRKVPVFKEKKHTIFDVQILSPTRSDFLIWVGPIGTIFDRLHLLGDVSPSSRGVRSSLWALELLPRYVLIEKHTKRSNIATHKKQTVGIARKSVV